MAIPHLAGPEAAIIALGGGLLGAAAFPQLGWWWAAPIASAALSVAVHGQRLRRSAWLGLLWGAAFFGPLLHWTSIFVGAPPWLILAAAQAGYIAALGPLLTLVQRLRWWPLWVGAAWVAQEALRGRAPFGGFPWGRWAFSQADSPARWFAALGGAPAVTAVVAVAGGFLAWASIYAISPDSGRPNRARRPLRLAGAVLASIVVLLGGGLLAPTLRPDNSDEPQLVVALIQGDVPRAGLEIETQRRQVLDNHVQQTLNLAAKVAAGDAPQPDLVVWPENASDIDPFTNDDAAQQIEKAVIAINAPILVGAILDGPGEKISNVGILWSPATGPGSVYSKRHPVPFAEYIPLRRIARMVSSDVDRVARDMASGNGNGLVTGGPAPIGDVICFEVAYDGLVRSSVRAGAQVLVVQTNNATFGHTSETYQQLAMSQLRAVEHGRVVLQVATSGMSAIIGPDGRMWAKSGELYTPAILVQSIPLRSTQTLATKLGALPEWLLCALALACGALALVGRPGRRGYDFAFVGTTAADTNAAQDPKESMDERAAVDAAHRDSDVQRAGQPRADREADAGQRAAGAHPGGG